MIFCYQHKTIPEKKNKNSITAPNESMNIHEHYVSCNMFHNSIDENDNSFTAPIQNNGCGGIKSTIVICFSEQHLFKINSVNSTKLAICFITA
jgi:hypothetical protein